MKKVKYSVYQKFIITMMSIVIGCETTKDINEKLGNGNLILRTDSGFGSSENIEKLLSIPKLKFITKAYSTVKAKNFAKDIPYSEYIQADKAAWVYEFSLDDGLRYIIVRRYLKKET